MNQRILGDETVTMLLYQSQVSVDFNEMAKVARVEHKLKKFKFAHRSEVLCNRT